MSAEVTEFGVCPKCGGNLRFQVSVFVDAPARMFHAMPKKALRSRDLRVMGVGWPTLSWYCPKGDWAERVAERAMRSRPSRINGEP